MTHAVAGAEQEAHLFRWVYFLETPAFGQSTNWASGSSYFQERRGYNNFGWFIHLTVESFKASAKLKIEVI